MSPEEQAIYNFIESYVFKKKKVHISIDTSIYSGGILDSLDMFGLILELERQNFKLKLPNRYIGDKLKDIDTAAKIIQLII